MLDMETNNKKRFIPPAHTETIRPYEIPQSNTLMVNEETLEWYGIQSRLETIHEGIPYDAIETIAQELNRPVKFMLSILKIPQTTYNKKKKEQANLDLRDGELILLIAELIAYGKEVFDQEDEKFQRWMQKPNISLGGQIPENLLDTASGIEELKRTLNAIDYGIFS